MKRWMILSAVCLTSSLWAGVIPNGINYQGTIKQAGIPVNGRLSMAFRLTNSDGTQVYWSGGAASVTVTDGMFSTLLSPSGVDWQNVIPYVEVSVNGQVLLPREPVAANAYAFMAGGVVDGTVTSASLAQGAVGANQLAAGSVGTLQLANAGVTLAKLAPDAQAVTVPSGMISMFAGPCPNGWTRFSDLDGDFIVGGAAYDGPFGQNSRSFQVPDHAHGITVDGQHNHGGLVGPSTVDDNDQWVFGDPQGSGSHSDNLSDAKHVHSIAMDGAHNHGGQTQGIVGYASSPLMTAASDIRPQYKTVVLCQKQ